MITLLTGGNNFALRQTLRQLIEDSQTEPERIDASDIEPTQLIDLLQGQSLFSQHRLVIIEQASQEKSVWSVLKDILPNANPDTTIVITASTADKRTATYKWLQKNAKTIDHPWWKSSDVGLAEKWLTSYAKQLNLQLSNDMANEMIARTTHGGEDSKPIIDQQQLANAIEQLTHASGDITPEMIDAVLAPATHENIFELLAAALRRETAKVQTMVDHLSQEEDGHRAMGLLVSQVTNLAALVLADDSITVDQVAKDIEAHPFAMRQLVRYASQLSRNELAAIVETIADADVRMKHSQAEPWVLIRTALLTISRK